MGRAPFERAPVSSRYEAFPRLEAPGMTWGGSGGPQRAPESLFSLAPASGSADLVPNGYIHKASSQAWAQINKLRKS